MKRASRRGGYALIGVLFFILLMLSLLGVAYRQIGAALRAESIRVADAARDAGSVQALALALALLETGVPPANPYECGVTIDTPSGPRSFTIHMSSQTDGQWTVQSSPTAQNDNPPPIPQSFLGL